MSERIGRFEIISQLAQSSFATVYKALDSQSDDTVALKVVRLDQVPDRAALVTSVHNEAETAKPLSSHNITVLHGVSEENDLLLAATEYVQGNSVATTLARHDGFSIWDIQDIARQVCQALDHANAHKAGHQSLEPAKIMVGWDGIVKVLGFGISTMNGLAGDPTDKIPEVLYYASPEQVRGECCDHRSVLFSLGAVLYEMATEQKPFPGETPDQVRQAILQQTPAMPVRLKPNVNRGLNDLIMRALSKSPDERFQSGHELVRDLENCKSGSSVAAPPLIAAAVQPKANMVPKAQAAAAGAGPGRSASSAPTVSASAAPAVEEKPKFAVDPMMAGESGSASGGSFSDIAEMPPLKDLSGNEPTPAAVADEAEVPAAKPADRYRHIEIEKPKLQVRQAAQKAASEIRKVPPKLMLYAIGGAVALIVLILAAMGLRNFFGNNDEHGDVAVSSSAPAQPVATQAAPQEAQQQAAPAVTNDNNAAQPAEPTPEPEQAQQSAAPATPQRSGRRGKSRTAAPAVVPAQLTVSSTPLGAQISFDGSVLCESPCTLTGIAPGNHVVTANKPGFSAASHNVALVAGANASVALQLEALAPMLSVLSTPAGAVIVIDGKDSGKLTPSQIALSSPGAHTVVLRRYGYLEGSSSINAEAGQTANVNMTLTALGSTEEIRAAGGKFNKVFKKGDAGGMGIVSVKTQPKGAQIMVNNRVLDKTAPFDFYLNPGTYVIDINMAGYRPVHRVISLQEGEKLAIQETLNPE